MSKEHCLSLYFNLVKKKKQQEAKKPTAQSKQIVMRSPSSQQRVSEQSLLEITDKENDSRTGNVSRFNASKILFNEERKTPK